MTLDTLLSAFPGIGKTRAAAYKKLGISTVRDLLLHLPYRYDDFEAAQNIRSAGEGLGVTLKVRIALLNSRRSVRRRIMVTEALVHDDSGEMRVVWFGQPYIAKHLAVGDEVVLRGRIERDMLGRTMKNPGYERARGGGPNGKVQIVPWYSATHGLSQQSVRALVRRILPLSASFSDWLPDHIRKKAGVISYAEAIRLFHSPDSAVDIGRARARFGFDEMFLVQLRSDLVRRLTESSLAPEMLFDESVIRAFVSGLPFSLTIGQKKAAWQIIQDMQKSIPMNRLLAGDVGSGKTVVAGISMRHAVQSGFQCAILAPTDVLARQHKETFDALFGKNTSLRILLCTGTDVVFSGLEGKTFAARRRDAYDKIATGQVDICVGTHALLGEKVNFHRLGLVIVDEQHRFGVGQRKMLKEKSGIAPMVPHFLSMTATPIPRTYALMLYGDLDVSPLREMPKGRIPVATSVCAERERVSVYAYMSREIADGRQCFVVCPRISSDEDSGGIPTVEDVYTKLSKDIFPNVRIGLLHGALSSQKKKSVMQSFVNGELDILISTSMVEVGVNVPNATCMVIEGADRFGLSQLHQLRGRVGRSTHKSACFLFSSSFSKEAGDRLRFFANTHDGFAIAEYDAERRGTGDLYGTAQSGEGELFRFANPRDVEMLSMVRSLVQQENVLEYSTIKERLLLWERETHLE